MRYHIDFSGIDDNIFEILVWYDQYGDTRMLTQSIRRSRRQNKSISLSRDSFEKLIESLVAFQTERINGKEVCNPVWVYLQDELRGSDPELYEYLQQEWRVVY